MKVLNWISDLFIKALKWLYSLGAWMGVAQDKVLHFLAGVFIGFVSSLWADYGYGHYGYAMLVGSGVGAAKELGWDMLYRKRKGDLWDFVATVVGTVVGMYLALLYRVIGS